MSSEWSRPVPHASDWPVDRIAIETVACCGTCRHSILPNQPRTWLTGQRLGLHHVECADQPAAEP